MCMCMYARARVDARYLLGCTRNPGSLYCLIKSNARERAVRLEFSEARYKFSTIGCAGENQIKERRTIYQ